MAPGFTTGNDSFWEFLRPLRRAASTAAGCKPVNSIKYALLKAALERLPERKLFCPMPFKMIEIERGEHQSLLLAPAQPGQA